jgi:ATP-binding cassette, subfamily G (WHITE), member 2, SNQ2
MTSKLANDAQVEEVLNEENNAPTVQGSHPLEPTTSTGTWGEEQRGEPVNVNQARADFELARQTSKQSQRHGRSESVERTGGILAGGRKLANTLSRSTQQASIAEQQSSSEEEGQIDGEKTMNASDDEFDLATFIKARYYQLEQENIDPSKPVGVSWKDLKVTAPGAGGGGILVKTLPKAIYNTVAKDPFGVISFFIPPFGKFINRKAFNTSTPLIQGQDGILRAGEMLLVLGRPGSGCSTALRALTASNHTNVSQSGTISYGGLSPEEIQKNLRGEVLFCDEDDIHFPTLTVAQTLQFALKNKAPTRSKRPSGETRQQFIETVSTVILKMFGMSHVRDTIVGDAFVRGVSGGERKRVTISEALIGSASVIAWDNSTRGLDASTALDYVRSLRIMTDLSQRTTMATLYQVSESIFDYFDRIAVIDEGRCIYYGPRDQARKFFYDMGYEAPSRETTADFVTGVTDPDQAVIRKDFQGPVPKTAEEREKYWKNSQLYANLLNEITNYNQLVQQSEKEEAQKLQRVSAGNKNSGVNKKSPYTVSFWEQIKACIWRQLLIRWGSRHDMQIKLFTIISVSLIISALFYGQGYDSTGVFTRGGVILFMCLFNGWLQLSEGFEAVAGRPMLMRHRQFAFHRPSAVIVARAIVDIPFLMVQCFLSLIIIWGIADLRRTAGAFFIYYVYVFFAAYNLTALYRMIAAFSPGFNEAIRFSVLALNVIIIFVGYIIRRPQMNWLIWLSYSNGISYAFEGMLVNEIAYDIPCLPQSIVPFNEIRDVAYQTCALTGSKPGSVVVTAADYLGTTFGYKRHHVSYDWAVLLAFSILYLIPTVLASELINWGGSGGGVTVYANTPDARRRIKGEQVAASPKNNDLESGGQGDSTRAPSREDSEAKGVNATKELSKEAMESRAIFTWKDINLALPNGRKLLQHVDGWVKPGELTALMGASGAGKTTLMSALSDRGVAGIVTGERMIDGKPLDQGFQKGTGLVLQADIHLATSTVREAFQFSARLRQPAEVSDEEKMKTVEHVLDVLELRPLQDALIGVPGAGLGVERRKRVTIGVELVAKPDLLLFLDEPTSGLDSAGASSIVRLLRKLAQEGQAILCTIHQPSSLLFEAFDNALLLKPGGETAYFGQIGKERGHGSELIRDYFERNGAPACPPEENAAEYILEVVSGGKGKKFDWGNVWRQSAESKQVREHVDQINQERKGKPARSDPRAVSKYSANIITQLREVTLRQIRDAWRDSSFSYGVLFSNFVTGLVAGGSFAHLGTSPTDLQNRVFITFLVLLNTPAMVNTVLSKFFMIRMLFEVRENQSKVYAWYALVFSFIVISVPIALVCSVLFFLPSYFIPFYAQPSWSAGFFYLNVITMQFWMFLFAFMLSASCPTPVTAANLLPFILPILFIGSGIIVPQSQMPQPFHSFVYYVNPVAYYVKGQIATVLHNQPVVCGEEDLYRFNPPPNQTCSAYAGAWAQSSGGYLVNGDATSNCGFCQFTVGDQFAASVSSEYSFRWQNYGILLGFTIFEVFLAFFCYWYFSIRHYGLGTGYITGPATKLVKMIFSPLTNRGKKTSN